LAYRTEGTFRAINQLDPKILIDNFLKREIGNLQIFFNFLNRNSVHEVDNSSLRIQIIKYIIEDNLKSYPIDFYCYIFHNIQEKDYNNSSKLKILIEQIEILELHETFLKYDASWLRYFLSLIKKLDFPIFRKFIESFTLEDMITIWKIPPPEDKESIGLVEMFQQLEASKWEPLPEFIEYFGLEYFMKMLNNSESPNFYEHALFNFLVESDWPSKCKFIQKFDFVKWVHKLSGSQSIKQLETFISLEIPNFREIVRVSFEILFHNEDRYDLEKLIEFCNDKQIDWHDWVDIPFIFNQAEQNEYHAQEFLDLLKDRGWKVPENLDSYILEVKEKREQKYLLRLNQMQKANRLYYTGKQKEALELFEKCMLKINEIKHIAHLQEILNLMNPLSKEEKKSLVLLISQNIFADLIIDESKKIHYYIWILKDLQKFGYPYIPYLIFSLGSNVIKQNETQFWSSLSNTLDITSIYKEIWEIFWMNEYYERIANLPKEFQEETQNNLSLIEKRLFNSESTNPFLWPLYVKTFNFGEKHEEERLDNFLKKILKEEIHLPDIFEIVSSLPQKMGMIFDKMVTNYPKKIINILQNSSALDIVHLLQILQNNRNANLLIEYISLVEPSVWEKKFQHLEVDVKKNLKLIFLQKPISIFQDIELFEKFIEIESKNDDDDYESKNSN
jgi:hypothetical protein